VFKKEFTLSEMRETYLSFFEKRGHTRIPRYPVVARWRDDIYLTIASIADFQPFVTSGLVPPPANPLTISQPCIRLGDLDAVGRSGRHLTTFEMMAHHAFNNADEEIYWKEETVEYCNTLLQELGADPLAITYKEEPWAGGGNAGPCLEAIVGGLEVATLVFMNLRQSRTGSITIKGERYERMDNYIVDTGYGLERFVWISSGAPTIYDAVFPDIVGELMNLTGIEHEIEDPEYASIFAANARFAGIMDISGKAKLLELRRRVAESIGIPVEKLQKIMEPVESVYAITDHTRCLTFMLGDGIIPSNVKAGYLARLVLRRCLRLMSEIGLNLPLSELINLQIKHHPEYPEFRERFDVISEILALEEEKYRDTLNRGRRLVTKTALHYKKQGIPIPLDELVQLYDTHGIPPEIAKEAAGEVGVEVDLPDTFYSQVAETHIKSQETAGETPAPLNTTGIPPTEKLYYEKPGEETFEATVLRVIENKIILDKTLFYPEGGGQPADKGSLAVGDYLVNVTDVQMTDNNVILHITDSDYGIKEGDRVTGRIDMQRRMAHARHHTATHIVNEAAKKVLGRHIWQTGAQKSMDRARLDLTHYKRITPEELKQIELLANQEVMANKPVNTLWMERTQAEQQFGFTLYQGGVPPGREIRILQVGDDVEACGGTHVQQTGDIGQIKILHTERIQDGVERVEFAAGEAAVKHTQEREEILNNASNILRVTPEHLPETVQRFFNEWKQLKKEVERLQEELAQARVAADLTEAEQIKNMKIVIKELEQADIDELIKIASEFTKYPNTVTVLASRHNGVKLVASASKEAIKTGINAGNIIREISAIVGGGGGGKPNIAQGGGKHPEKIEEALQTARNIIKNILI
jgi:alanyl-tRNA synthetase